MTGGFRWLLPLLIVSCVMVIVLETRAVVTGKMSVLDRLYFGVTGAAGKGLHSIRGFFTRKVAEKEALGEATRLKERVQALERMVVLLEDQAMENQKLRALLELQTRQEWKGIAASLIGRDPGNWFREVVIDKGFAQGVRQDLPVVTGEGLVGRTVQVSGSFSRVMLIMDPGNAVPAQVLETRSLGIAYGTGVAVEMKYIEHDAFIREGDTVITSGLGAIYPKGLLIGKITQVTRKEHALFKSAMVKPYVNFWQLEQALVLAR